MSRNKDKNDKVADDLNNELKDKVNGKCISEPGDVRKPEDCKRAV
jgi:hypothetical protein